MKCCIVSPYPPDKCGIALYTFKLANALSKLVNIIVIANKENEMNAETSLSSKVKILRCWRRNTFSYPFKIFKAILKEKPDIIHIQHEFLAYGVRKYSAIFPILLFLINLLFKPIVITMHSVVPLEELNEEFFSKHGVGKKFTLLKKFAMIFTVKLIGLFSRTIIVHNALMKNYLIHEYGIKKLKVIVIPHGIDSISIKNVAIENRYPNNNLILFFGFIAPGKGIEILIDAFSKLVNILPKTKLLILGSYHPRLFKENPSYIGSIEKKIKEAKLEDKILFENKFVNDENLQSCIQVADVIVFPYTDKSVIGASGALASCIIFGKPIIATKIPRFNAELKNGVNAILVNPNDKKELHKALLKLLLNEDLRKKLCLNLKTLASNRSWQDIAIKTIKVYEAVFKLIK